MKCSNATASGLAHALSRFEMLIYLDLSFANAARETPVLNTLRMLSGLQILKLRSIGLTDASLSVLAKGIGLRVRSLDIRDNRITDRGVRTLLDYCFLSSDGRSSGARSPTLLSYLGADMLEIYQGEEFEGYLRTNLTTGFVSHLAIEDVPEGGVTHLYISGNQISVEGASGLIRSCRLHVLDLASVINTYDTTDIELPGVEKLTPILSKFAESLSFLRIDHSLITRDVSQAQSNKIVSGRSELGDTSLPLMPRNAVEIDGTTVHPPTFELSTEHSPRFELPGDPVQFVISPVMNDTPHSSANVERFDGQRGSASAPELADLPLRVDEGALLSPVSALENGTGTMLNDIMPSSSAGLRESGEHFITGTARPRSYSSLGMDRKARLAAHSIGSHNLHPAMLPRLTTLMLTNVPPTSPDDKITERLIIFIKQSGEEARLAIAQAKLDYAPPGRVGHMSAIKQSAGRLFALKRIVLELGANERPRQSAKSSKWRHMAAKSVTDDRDSEALWSAAETDFSFFGEGDEVDYLNFESGASANSMYVNEKEVSYGGVQEVHRQNVQESNPPDHRFDNIAALSAFRQDRKFAHERALAAGSHDPETDGYWPGIVQVVRTSNNVRADEELDYYGNTYSGGYLYR
ncbi:hypothetical protein LTR62_000829 [Meristemomyces frigidus]|uniref:Leucine rich repeat protein n=1 Tax=Meristemomyces frigidus TaxID=1508187 RepID=A0AAN7YIB1_9PEZI|nr:hypothetical protein LTR62_000829 [Meristemomyces frigidus]